MLLEEDMKGADMKKNKNLILSSFFMFAISLACLITESYAWFSMTGSVEVTGPEFKASAPENLQISMMEYNGHRQLLLICTRRTILKLVRHLHIQVLTTTYSIQRYK